VGDPNGRDRPPPRGDELAAAIAAGAEACARAEELLRRLARERRHRQDPRPARLAAAPDPVDAVPDAAVRE
jgi:hypothetical protein